MQIIFCRSDRLFGRLIRLGTWSDWSHVAALVGDTVYEAATSGVRKQPVEAVLSHYPKHEILPIALPDEDAAVAFLEAQIGKPYDFRAIFGFLTQRDWAEDDKWFCSKLVETAILKGGKQRFRERMSRITPQHSWMATV